MMSLSYREGLWEAGAQWRLLLLAFGITLLGGLSFMAVAWLWLAEVLGDSLVTRTLATSLDAHVFLDIFLHHGSSLRIFAGTIAVLLGAGLLLWIWINAVIVISVSSGERRLADVFRSAGGKYRTFFSLWLFAMVCNVLGVTLLYLASHTLRRLVEPLYDEIADFAVLAGCTITGALLVVVVTTVHDHARVRCAETGEGAWRAFLWAWVFVLRQPHAFLLTLALMSTVAGIWLFYQAIAALVPVTTPTGLAVSLLWAQCFMLARVFVRIWTFAAAAALQWRAAFS